MSGEDYIQSDTDFEPEARRNLVGFFDVLIRIDKRLKQEQQDEQEYQEDD